MATVRWRNLEASPREFDLIIVDQEMPHLSGVELVREIRERDIPAKIMVLSAHLSAETREAYEQMGVRVILSKPFGVGELRVAVSLSVEDSDSSRPSTAILSTTGRDCCGND
jgi:DNA-binding response OmpR family regulator